MTATSARVEVLTAEVRVLMVGSRQVTMSVYNQLDEVDCTEITPFGRVAPRDPKAQTTYVVGVSTRDADRGTLVRSELDTAASLRDEAGEFRRRAAAVRELAALTAARDQAEQAFRDAARDREEYRLVREAQQQIHQFTRQNYYAEQDAQRGTDPAALESSAADLEYWITQAAQWEALPLIVLAGLR